MTEPQIGQWTKRKGGFHRHVDDAGNERWTGPRWHRVESLIADRAVVRCGKQLLFETAKGPLEVSEVEPFTRLIGQPHLCRGGCQ